MGDDLDAAIAEVGDVDGVAEVAGQAVDLDALLQEGGEGGRVEDAVLGRLGGIDHELYHCAEPVSISFPQTRRLFTPKAAARVGAYLLGDLLVLPRATLQAATAGGRSLLHSGIVSVKPSPTYCADAIWSADKPVKASRQAGSKARYVLVQQPLCRSFGWYEV